MEPVYGFVGNEDSGCIRCAAAPGDKADGDHHLECQDAAYSNSHSSRSSPCVNWLCDAECTEKSPRHQRLGFPRAPALARLLPLRCWEPESR